MCDTEFETNKQTNETKDTIEYHNICCPESVTCTISSQQITCDTFAKGSSLINPDLIREVRPPRPLLSFGSLTRLQYFQR